MVSGILDLYGPGENVLLLVVVRIGRIQWLVGLGSGRCWTEECLIMIERLLSNSCINFGINIKAAKTNMARMVCIAMMGRLESVSIS